MTSGEYAHDIQLCRTAWRLLPTRVPACSACFLFYCVVSGSDNGSFIGDDTSVTAIPFPKDDDDSLALWTLSRAGLMMQLQSTVISLLLALTEGLGSGEGGTPQSMHRRN